MIGGHSLVTKSPIYLVWMLHWSRTHVSDGTDNDMCESRARTVRHSVGMVGGQSSVTLHRLCELKYAGAQGTVLQHFLRHDTTSRVDSTAQKTKITIFHSFRSR